MTAHALRILIVEDEMFVAMLIEDMIVDLGHTVAGTAARVTTALAMVGEIDFDVAVLDVNLAGEMSFPVADAVAALGRPFVFATGYGRSGLVEPHARRPVVSKPFSVSQLGSALDAAMLENRASSRLHQP